LESQTGENNIQRLGLVTVTKTRQEDWFMKLAIVVSTNEAEAVFNAMRLGNYAAKEGDDVGVFLVGKGVELDRIEDDRFDVRAQAEAFLSESGRILACGTCLKLRESSGSDLCPLSTMKDLYELIRDADRVVSF